jgi:membrane associated rhomboid family serine protease
VDYLALGGSLDQWGVRPRSLEGLWGLAFAPFLHHGFSHLMANTLPLAVLGGLVLWRSVGDWVAVTVAAAVLGGLGVWLVAPANSVHLGASILVFGYFGYLLLCGWYERSIAAVAVAVVVAALYGGLIWGVLPGEPGVSWQGHLVGFLAGAACARALAKRAPSASTEL